MHTDRPDHSQDDRRITVRRFTLPGSVNIWHVMFILLMTAVGVLLTMQGWKSHVPAFDILTYIHSSRDFLDHRIIPQHGDTGSYGQYKPPGTAWLMMPSMLLFDDPRMTEFIGPALLHLSTLTGIFLLARHYFGVKCAYLAVILYGLSHHGLFLAGSLWPTGRPDFYVWIIYMTTRWVSDRDGRFLAGAFAIWAVGMYVDMAITPVVLVPLAAWLYYRPPVRLLPLAASGTTAFVIWLPYLQLQASRGFQDLRAQLLLQPMSIGNIRETWCDPTLAMLSFWDRAAGSESSVVPVDSAGVAIHSSVSPLQITHDGAVKLTSNFDTVASVPGANIALLVLVLFSIAVFSVTVKSGTSARFVIPEWVAQWFRSTRGATAVLRRRTPLAVAAVTAGLAISSIVLLTGSGGIVWRIAKVTVGLGMLALLGIALVVFVSHLLAARNVELQTPEGASRVWLLTLGLVLPWAALLVSAEIGRPERFWWLWPVQLIFLAAFFTVALPRFVQARWLLVTAQVAVVAVIAANGFLIDRVSTWMDDGWSGQEAQEVQALDVVAADARSTGITEASIGYQILIYPFMAEYNVTNPLYKVGAEFDVMLGTRIDLVNSNTCAEGIAAGDDYRIVQTRPKPWEGSPDMYFDIDVASDPEYSLIAEVPSYLIFKRDDGAIAHAHVNGDSQ